MPVHVAQGKALRSRPRTSGVTFLAPVCTQREQVRFQASCGLATCLPGGGPDGTAHSPGHQLPAHLSCRPPARCLSKLRGAEEQPRPRTSRPEAAEGRQFAFALTRERGPGVWWNSSLGYSFISPSTVTQVWTRPLPDHSR